MQQLTDQSVDQRKDVPRQYLDIALIAGQYKIYCPAMAIRYIALQWPLMPPRKVLHV